MEENLQEHIQDNTPEQGLFDDHVQFTQASQGSRFLNWLIDNLFMNYALSYATGYLVGYILSIVAPDFLITIAYGGEKGFDYYLLAFTIIYVNYFLYYTICEKAFNGYTLGKALTGTRAIRNDGQALRFKDAALRTLSRMVPFEAFSGFGDKPWHDSWTNTTVIKAR